MLAIMDLLPGLLTGSVLSNSSATTPYGDPSAPSGDGDGVDKGSCSLLGQTALVVQALMALLVLLTLVLKRAREQTPRPWIIWAADVSKQVIGQGFLHSSNILISTLFQHHQARDACVAYFLSIFVDCTLGVGIIYGMMRLFSYVLIGKLHLEGFKTGQYYSCRLRRKSAGEQDEYEDDGRDSFDQTRQTQSSFPDDSLPSTTASNTPSVRPRFHITWWARQLLVYILTLCVMKAAIIGFFWIPWVFPAGDWLLSWLGEDTRVVFVLMIFPLLMNAFQVCHFSLRRGTYRTSADFMGSQFLLIDAILKSSNPLDAAATGPDGEPKGTLSNGHRDGGGDDEENQAFLARQESAEDDDLPERQGRLPRHQSSASSSRERPATPPRHTHFPLSSTPPNERDTASYPPSYRSSYSQSIKNEKAQAPQKIEIRLEEPTPQKGQAGRGQRTILTARPRSVSPIRSSGRRSEDEKTDAGGWDWLDEEDEGEDDQTSAWASREHFGQSHQQRIGVV